MPLHAKSFSEGWALGYRYIPAVRIVHGIIGRCDRRGVKSCWPAIVIIAGAWPLWLNLFLIVANRPLAVTSKTSLLWLSGLSFLDVLMLFAAWSAWTFAHRRSERIDRLLEDPAEKEMIGRWLAARVAPRRQMIFPTITVISSVYFLYSNHIRLSADMHMDISLISYLCLAWTFLLGGIDVYWLFTAPALPRMLYHCRSLKLRWQDPASTPGIELLADGFGVSALFLLAGAGVILGLAFWAPGFADLAVFNSAIDGFFVLIAVLCFRVGLYTYIWIYAIVKRDKRRALDQIESSMPLFSKGSAELLVNQASLYRTISSAPELPFSTGAVIQYTATLLGVITAFIIQLVYRMPS
jgi:hypothetical protein